MPRVTLLSTSDTDLLSARSSGADYALANPSRLDVASELAALLRAADLVIVRILGSARSWQDGLDAVRAVGVPMIVLGGE
jgi:cobaltochelatase CobN